MKNILPSSPSEKLTGSDLSSYRDERMDCDDSVRGQLFKVLAAIGIGAGVIGIGGFYALNNKSQPAQQAAQAENTSDLAVALQRIVDEHGGILQITSNAFKQNIDFVKWGLPSPPRDHIDFRIINTTSATLNEALKITNGSCNLTVELLPEAHSMAHRLNQNDEDNTHSNVPTSCYIQDLRILNVPAEQLATLRNALHNIIIYGKLFHIEVSLPPTGEHIHTEELENILTGNAATTSTCLTSTRDGKTVYDPDIERTLMNTILNRARLDNIPVKTMQKRVIYNERHCALSSEEATRLASQ